MKRIWAVRKDSEAVSPVIATILMVAITVVLAAVLYVMVLGFGTSGSTPTLQITSRVASTSPEANTFKLTKPTAEVAWTDFTVTMQYGSTSLSWNTASREALTGTGVMTQQLAASGGFYVNVTDMIGNGVINDGDLFVIVGDFTAGTLYTVTLLHEPTGGTMVSTQWTAT